ncbi:hypothetical protein ACHAL6_10420 [Proteiniclasticum sp. C24MP]|uniref:hypothetical protein n=1 Tax=Proteiniclasticum sp. C24MP TaxID=3374101 RepID=UPI0037544CB7
MKRSNASRNILLVGGVIALISALLPGENKDIIGRILFGMLSILFLLGAYLQQKDHKKRN